MTRMIFGRLAEDVDTEQFARLDDHSSLYKDQLESRWERVPSRFQKQFGAKAIYLSTHDFQPGSRTTSFLAEWDDMEAYLFRGDEIWIARSSRAHLTFRKFGDRWILLEEVGKAEGDPWSVVPRVGKVAFDRPRAVATVDISPDLLKEIVANDSHADRYIWWKGVEDGVDGALRGDLPRNRGFRARFDAVAKPTFARFESIALSKQISISSKNGSISGPTLLPAEIVQYFEQHILPRV